MKGYGVVLWNVDELRFGARGDHKDAPGHLCVRVITLQESKVYSCHLFKIGPPAYSIKEQVILLLFPLSQSQPKGAC